MVIAFDPLLWACFVLRRHDADGVMSPLPPACGLRGCFGTAGTDDPTIRGGLGKCTFNQSFTSASALWRAGRTAKAHGFS